MQKRRKERDKMFDQSRITGKPKHDESKIKITKDTSEKDMLRFGEYACGTCTHCCEYGGGLVLEGEIQKMALLLGISDEEFKEMYLDEVERFNRKVYKFKVKGEGEMPFGPCIFLDKGCRIHKVKPLYCRIATCGKLARKQLLWYDLNRLIDKDDPEAIRQYVMYLRFGETIEGGEIEKLVPDKERLKKMLEYGELE